MKILAISAIGAGIEMICCKYWRAPEARHKECQRLMDAADISAGNPIVDLNSYNVPDQYDRMDFRELVETIVARGGLYIPTADTPSQTEEMRRWLRDDDAVSNAGCLVYPPSSYIDEPPDPRRPHAFILNTTSGLTHTEYRVCKCGLSEFNAMHTREDTNAKTNQNSSQT